jgi:protein TonB
VFAPHEPMIHRQLRVWVIPVVSSSLLHLGIAWVALGMALAWAPPLPEALPVELIETEPPPPRPVETPPPVRRPKRATALEPIAPSPAPLPPPSPVVEPPPEPRTPAPPIEPKLETPPAPAAAPAPARPAEVKATEARRPEVASPEVKREEAPGILAVPLPVAAAPGPSRDADTGPPAPTSAAVPPRSPAAPVAVARAGEVTRAARPSGGYQVIPTYPRSARRLGIEGTALLRVLVLADGHVGTVTVQKSAGHPDLDRAAADAVRQWRFDPARRGTDAVAMWVLLPVEFRLKD